MEQTTFMSKKYVNASLRIAEKLGFNFVGHYPILDYLGKQHHATIDFDLWRIRNCQGEVSEGELLAAAFRIGMFVGQIPSM